MHSAGYGILLPIGLFVGLGIGIALGQASLGTVIGLGIGGLLAIALRLRG